MRNKNKVVKDIFDLLVSFVLFPLLLVPILVLVILATIDTREFGLFIQKRVGLRFKEFYILKIRTLNKEKKASSFGRFLRKYKLDEIPQIVNVLIGNMSLVGARPELPEYFLIHRDYPKIILEYRPGITGLASIHFYNEDALKNKLNNEKFEKWMYLRKKTLNIIYSKNQSLCFDIKIMYLTFVKILGV